MLFHVFCLLSSSSSSLLPKSSSLCGTSPPRMPPKTPAGLRPWRGGKAKTPSPVGGTPPLAFNYPPQWRPKTPPPTPPKSPETPDWRLGSPVKAQPLSPPTPRSGWSSPAASRPPDWDHSPPQRLPLPPSPPPTPRTPSNRGTPPPTPHPKTISPSEVRKAGSPPFSTPKGFRPVTPCDLRVGGRGAHDIGDVSVNSFHAWNCCPVSVLEVLSG